MLSGKNLGQNEMRKSALLLIGLVASAQAYAAQNSNNKFNPGNNRSATVGWHLKVCSYAESRVIPGGGVGLAAFNNDGSTVGTDADSPTLFQIQLTAACQDKRPYAIHVTDPSTGYWDGIRVR